MQDLMDLANAGEYAALDNAMEAAAQQLLNDIESKVVVRFPDRKEILADAFDAHRSRKFTLSIPTLLVQADGIGSEVLEKVDYFFRRGRSNEKALERLGCRFGTIDDAFFEILRHEPTFVSRDARNDSTIDRHDVLHGKNTTYHTEVNSLRAVVLVGYLTDASNTIERWRQSEREFQQEIQALKKQYGIN
jgi:hypothetical protein